MASTEPSGMLPADGSGALREECLGLRPARAAFRRTGAAPQSVVFSAQLGFDERAFGGY